MPILKRFEFRKGKSNKFWEVSVLGSLVVVKFGRIGSEGQYSTKLFKLESEAVSASEKMAKEKTKKGYQLVWQGDNPGGSALVAQDMSEDSHTAVSLIDWLKKCIKEKADPRVILQFFEDNQYDGYTPGCDSRDIFPDDEEENSEKDNSPKLKKSLLPDFGIRDVGSGEYDMKDLGSFCAAVVRGKRKVVYVDEGEYCSIVAVNGEPGARTILKKVANDVFNTDPEDHLDDWDSFTARLDWPIELGPGCPIRTVDGNSDVIHLADNSSIKFKVIPVDKRKDEGQRPLVVIVR